MNLELFFLFFLKICCILEINGKSILENILTGKVTNFEITRVKIKGDELKVEIVGQVR